MTCQTAQNLRGSRVKRGMPGRDLVVSIRTSSGGEMKKVKACESAGQRTILTQIFGRREVGPWWWWRKSSVKVEAA